MSDLIIFLFGLGVTAITATATVLIGLSEARDPNHARHQDLNRLEKKIIGQERNTESNAA